MNQEKIKVSVLYSPSHKQMLDEYFLPSFPNDDRLELHIVDAPQLAGEVPSFNSFEWTEFMKIKAKFLYDELLSIDEGHFFIFLDVDILTVNNFTDYLFDKMKHLDVLCQSDSPHPQYVNYCTGIAVFSNNEQTRNLLKATYMILTGELQSHNFPKFKNEQEIFTFLIVNKNKFEELRALKTETMPFDIAFTYGSIAGKVWDGTDLNFEIPDKNKVLWLHGNYTNYNEKIPILKLFKEKLNK